jgi:hypothetical protein
MVGKPEVMGGRVLENFRITRQNGLNPIWSALSIGRKVGHFCLALKMKLIFCVTGRDDSTEKKFAVNNAFQTAKRPEDVCPLHASCFLLALA